MKLSRCALVSALILACSSFATRAEDSDYFASNPGSSYLSGDFLASRVNNQRLPATHRRSYNNSRNVIFVPTAYYRTKDYNIAYAYRPVFAPRASLLRSSAAATGSRYYRLSSPAISNEQMAHYRSYTRFAAPRTSRIPSKAESKSKE